MKIRLLANDSLALRNELVKVFPISDRKRLVVAYSPTDDDPYEYYTPTITMAIETLRFNTLKELIWQPDEESEQPPSTVVEELAKVFVEMLFEQAARDEEPATEIRVVLPPPGPEDEDE